MIYIAYIVCCLWVLPTNAQRELKIEFDQKALEKEYSIETLRFYLSKMQFHLSGDRWYKDEACAYLIDLDDSDSWEIPLPKEVAKGSIDSVSFWIGVDSLTNVSGILEGDLDPINGMYWAWNSGYINFKIEGEKHASSTGFEYHLGGYLAPFSAARKVCLGRSKTNKKLTVQINLKAFLDGIEMDELREVMVPGPDAAALSDHLSNCFLLE